MSKLLKFESKTCMKCPVVSNFLDAQSVTYEVIDVEDNEAMAIKYGIMAVPVVILLDDNGKEVQRSMGINPPELLEMINKLKQ